MTAYTLSLHTDRLPPKVECRLPAGNRVLYIREGDVIARAGGQAAGLAANSAWQGRDALAVTAGAAGAISSLTLAGAVELGDAGGYLMRCDRVDFPLGGIAYTHVHRGPGIRCLLAGGIRVEVGGKAHDIAPGEAWFEAGPEPVLAYASKNELTAFVRVMILPREVRGKSSIRYVRPEDADKPKLQTYRIFADELMDL